MKREIVDIRSEEGSAAERSGTVGRIEPARLSAGRDCDRHLEARAGIRLLNYAAEGCDGLGDFGEARDRDASLRNALADEHGELTTARILWRPGYAERRIVTGIRVDPWFLG